MNNTDASPKFHRGHWTPKESDKIYQLILEGKSITEIHAHFPHKSRMAIERRKSQIRRLTKMDIHAPQPWSAEEDEKMKTFIQQRKGLKEIRQQFPGRSPKAVEFRWYRFGGGQQQRSPIAEESRKKHPWTTEEIERLRIALDKDMALFDIYQQFPGRTPSAIRRYITELRYAQDGIHQQHSRGALDDTAHTGNETENRNVGFNRRMRTHKPWTPKEDELLTDLVAKHSDDVPGLWDRMDDAYSKNRTNDFPLYRSGKSACKRWLQLNFAECRTGPWDAEEIVKLKQSIQEQIGNEFQVLLDVRHRDYAAEVETAEQDTRPGLKVGGPELKKLNWHKVSQQVGTKQAEECQRYLFYVLHNGRRGPWTLDEVQRLKDGVEKFGNRWEEVVAHVGTRSRTQVMWFYWKGGLKKKEHALPVTAGATAALEK